MSAQSNLYLFFSNYCPHSKKVITRLSTSSIANSITFCCVDNKQLKIPPFVKSVPTLYIANQQRVLTDQGLLMWMDLELKNSQSGNQSGAGGGGGQQRQPMAPQQPVAPQQPSNPANSMNGLAGNVSLTGSNDISAYHSNEIGAGFSDNYSFIENPSNSLTHSFTFLDGAGGSPQQQGQNPNIGLPSMSMSAEKQNEKSAMMDKAYAQLMEQRKMDMPAPMSAMRV